MTTADVDDEPDIPEEQLADGTDGDTDEPDGDTDEDTDGSDDRPSMTADDMADFGDVAADIEAGGGDSGRYTDSTGENQEIKTGDSQTDDDGSDAPDVDGVSLGQVYTNALGMSAAVGRTRFGSASEDERDDIADEYAELARQIEIDKYLDQWAEQNGGLDSLSPGQAVLLATLMWAGVVLVDDPEMAGTLADSIDAEGVPGV